MLAYVQTSRICQHVLGRLDVCPNILKYQDVQTCISKRPEIPGRLDVRLNVLAFQDVYTYFLGCLDAIKISFDVYKFCFCDGDGDDDDGLPAYSHHDKIPPWWGNVSNDEGGNVSVSKTHHTP